MHLSLKMLLVINNRSASSEPVEKRRPRLSLLIGHISSRTSASPRSSSQPMDWSVTAPFDPQTGRWVPPQLRTMVIHEPRGIFRRLWPYLDRESFAKVMMIIMCLSLFFAFCLVVYYPDATLM